MKWVVVLTALLSVNVIGQDFSSCYVDDFFKVKGEIIFASPVDTIRSFERFTLLKVEYITDTVAYNVYLTKKLLTLKDYKGKTFQMKDDKILYLDVYDAQCLKQMLSKNKHQYYYSGPQKNDFKLVPWQLYQLTDLGYDYEYEQPYYLFKSGSKTFKVDKYFFKSENFIDAAKYNTLTSKYGQVFAKDILQGEIRIGMTKEMVEESWGTPDDYSYYVSQYGKIETYRYSYGIVTFTNERVSSIYVP